MEFKHLLLDLDNTLYASTEKMGDEITERMHTFISQFLNISYDEAVSLRAKNLPSYGTTLEWLKDKYSLKDEKAYFDAVHPEQELNELTPDPGLRPFLISLALPMTVLTNSPMAHAERVLRFFNIEDLFCGIFDLTFHHGKGKPNAECFYNTLASVGFSVRETLFVDDHPKYVMGYKHIGGRAALVDQSGRYFGFAQKEDFFHIPSIYGLEEILRTH
ncbi:HAD-IA family hydrolase [Brucepastera parasyntrophica]|uniref:HAD-IA family hydrolase n=1 Tax=Brucepastera parasyntrophica TaxID=2880008 RepID=UPI002109F218|nr:HAD-IA family hydrolase [Brucepastera parasyntrophica]ULQ58914.1 HAD-IA family hydrolase [Brucepastera parasyntrophica]